MARDRTWDVDLKVRGSRGWGSMRIREAFNHRKESPTGPQTRHRRAGQRHTERDRRNRSPRQPTVPLGECCSRGVGDHTERCSRRLTNVVPCLVSVAVEQSSPKVLDTSSPDAQPMPVRVDLTHRGHMQNRAARGNQNEERDETES